MTSTIIPKSPDTLVGDDLSIAGYSDKEISLIGYCWKDAEAINKDKTSLAMHLWELKQEMDANDPREDARNVKSRFWAAFDAGHLPYAGDKGMVSVHTCLRAASFLEDIAADLSFKYLNDKLRNLAPATLYEISNLEGEAQDLVFKSVESCDFIGVAAVRLIAHEAERDVFKKLFAWVDDHPSTAITPKTIRALQAEVAVENTPASTQTVDASTADRQAAAFERIMADVRERAPERERQAKVNAVKEELERPAREDQQRLEEKVRNYNRKLITAFDAVHDLLIFLRGIDRVNGTQYLNDMRQTDVMGLVTVRDDLPRIKSLGEELMEIAQLANSFNPPNGIDMTTLDVEQL
jgi:hypothetical protein